MTAALFSIRCTTCQRSLKVRSAAAVGQILACPKCGSMVHVTPPADWSASSESSATVSSAVGGAPATVIAARLDEAATPDQPALADARHDEQPPRIPPWMSPTEAALRKWTLLAGLPVAGAIVIWVAVSVFFSSGDEPATLRPDAEIAAGAKTDDQNRVDENPPTKKPSATPPIGPDVTVPAAVAADVEADVDDGLDDRKTPPPLTASDEDPLPSPPEPAGTTPVQPPLVAGDEAPQEAVEDPEVDDAVESNDDVRPRRAHTSSSPPVAVAARLDDKLLAIDQPRIKLAELIDLLSALTTVPITFDWDEMADAGVQPDDDVTVKMTDASVREVLQSVLEPLGLEPVVENHQLLITSTRSRNATLRTVDYKVSDLIEDPSGGAAELAGLVRRFVQPSTWRETGGVGAIEASGDALTVTHGDAAQQEVLSLLEKLRVARGMPPARGRGLAEFSLETRYSRAQDALGATVTANFRRPQPLADIVAHFQDATNVNLSINWLALRNEGISPEVEASVVAADEPLGDALEELLRPLDLTYRIVDARWLFITTCLAAASQPELEFYDVRPLLNENQTAAALVEAIQGQVAPAGWRSAGGPGDAHFDAASGYLLVLQTHAAHAELEEFLEGQREDSR